MLLAQLVSYNDDVDGEVVLVLMAILGGIIFIGAIFEAVGEGGCLFILLMLLFIYLAYSDSEKKAEEAEAKEATTENKAVNINNLRNVIVSPLIYVSVC